MFSEKRNINISETKDLQDPNFFFKSKNLMIQRKYIPLKIFIFKQVV